MNGFDSDIISDFHIADHIERVFVCCTLKRLKDQRVSAWDIQDNAQCHKQSVVGAVSR